MAVLNNAPEWFSTAQWRLALLSKKPNPAQVAQVLASFSYHLFTKHLGTNGGIIVPIVLAVIVVLILIIIAAVFITKYVRRKKVRKSSAGSKNAAAETQTASVPMEPLQVPQPQLHPVPTTNTPPPPVPTRPIQVRCIQNLLGSNSWC